MLDRMSRWSTDSRPIARTAPLGAIFAEGRVNIEESSNAP
jgi:hypothetical protein